MKRPGIGCAPVRPTALLWVATLCAASCGGGGGGGGDFVGVPGEEFAKPGGGVYICDPNQGGSASRLRLVEMFWGRLVDVHDQDEHGVPSPQPIYRDFVVSEDVQTNGNHFHISTNPLTQRTRLLVRRTHGAPDAGSGTFHNVLRLAESALGPIVPKNDDGTASVPFSYLPRNAALVLRFDDLLEDSEQARRELVENVRVLTGYSPSVPFGARVFFDRNHGGLRGEEFHSTRVIVDLSVSQFEASASPVPLELNSDGLPASLITTPLPNAALRIPTRLSPGTGQYTLLRGLSGGPLAELDNGPRDANAPTRDIVRAVRAGNAEDMNNGFLLDLNPPSILGGWPVAVESARAAPGGISGIDWSLDLRFTTLCRGAPQVGNLISIGELALEVQNAGSAPNAAGRVQDVRARALLDEPVQPASLIGQGLFLNAYDASIPVATGCWVTFTPQPEAPPQGHVSPEASILVRFTEPMDPTSIDALETFLLVRGSPDNEPASDTIVIGSVAAATDLRAFTLTPLLPLPHAGLEEQFHLRLGAFTDLAGNGLPDAPNEVTFTIDPLAEPHDNAGLVLRFADVEEMPPFAGRDLRGQFFYDFTRGRLLPRAVSFQTAPADRNNPIPGIMIPFLSGVQTPISPLGSKLQAVWRYCDLGWNVRDETKYNVDVVGLSWSPIGGQAIRDFYESFEIRLAHSRYQPDECLDQNLLPQRPNSGLVGNPRFFADNLLVDPLSPQTVVHERALGYSINPADVYLGQTGTAFLPYPLNRTGGPLTSFTWRDTAALRKAATGGEGIPLCIEASRTIQLEEGSGRIAPNGQVPTMGLPLLIEYRCYPSDSGVGLNALDVSLAINSSARPNFRAYSTGGINRSGVPVRVDPDLEDVPRGGFNPQGNPPGSRTTNSAENAFYIGQVDYVTRVSRVHSAWFDAGVAPNYSPPIIFPRAEDQPLGTSVQLDFRGAESFNMPLANLDSPYDALRMNAYGELFFVNLAGFTQPLGTVNFHNRVNSWTNDINAVDGARYLQVRISFLSNMDTGLTAELGALGIPYEYD